MKIKYEIFGGIAIVAISAMFLTGCTIPKPAAIEGAKSLKLDNLKLVAKYKPLHLYVYVDTTSTNAMPDYLISQGSPDLPVVFRETTSSNTVETTYFENGYSVLATKRDENGQVLRRCMNYDDDLGRQIYSYIDMNGDGLFDVFIKYGTNGEMTAGFVRSNLCWVAK